MISFTLAHLKFNFNSINSLPPLQFRVTEDSLVSVVHLAQLDLLVPVVPLVLLETTVLR